ncbi:LysM peptidoglycan-binding domain-containing protein [Lutispora saccharofermentans]|uniref:Glycoside hydrolase family 18 protein n=1 Tax=Lutispora saccharofermentans TaxID=3024236 RepID=A0ABT1NAA8_9FIRM|nr:glycoside hydrolase family 18 protein [Lutispora saccharofermentans]MCQ1528185.1 glycoside hydrolase family 18 protein [Lutispora saccharofermentans]
MTIYVVKRGDSLWSISRQFGVPVNAIIEANGIADLPFLVVGQALAIPRESTVYTVRPGDSLWSIANQFGTTAARLAEYNGISNPALIYPGMQIRIPSEDKMYGDMEINAYAEQEAGAQAAQDVAEVAPYLTYASPFSYQVNPDGTLNSINDEPIIEAARNNGVAPLMIVTNFRNGNFDTQLAHEILTNENIQQTLIDNIITTMKNKGYYGLNIDFERVDPNDRELYNNFLRKITPQLHSNNFVVSTALAPKTTDVTTGAWHGAHDYKAHGEIVDFVIIMTYEWGWSGGPPMAVAPINEVRKVLDYAVSVIPRDKIMMGAPLYGYDWSLPYTPGGEWARRISPDEAVRLAGSVGAEIQYDEEAQSPHFNYTDSSGVGHEVWFEDARSAEAKNMLAASMGLKGISYWVLGEPFVQNWTVLDNMFNIVKRL